MPSALKTVDLTPALESVLADVEKQRQGFLHHRLTDRPPLGTRFKGFLESTGRETADQRLVDLADSAHGVRVCAESLDRFGLMSVTEETVREAMRVADVVSLTLALTGQDKASTAVEQVKWKIVAVLEQHFS